MYFKILAMVHGFTTTISKKLISRKKFVPVKKSWECESVKVWGIPTSKTVKKAVISNTWDMTQEIDLANDNKRFELGISEDKTLQDKYIAYLNKVEEIKQMVESDFLNYSGQLIQ